MNASLEKQIQKHALTSPLDIPEGKSGRWSIKHEIHKNGSELSIVGQRMAILTGQKQVKLKLTEDRRIHKLLRDGGVVMSDIPEEMFDHLEFFLKAHGRVLIGGLGLGYIATKLLENKKVSDIVVVEKSKDVIKLVEPHLDDRITVVNSDLFTYLKQRQLFEFDCAYYDIWTGTGESDWVEYVVPLRRVSAKRNPEMDVWCWKEGVMQGQIAGPFGGLYRNASLTSEHPWLPTRTFQAAVREAGLKLRPINLQQAHSMQSTDFQETLVVEQENRANPVLQALADLYLNRIGSPEWEKRFGIYWDRFQKEKR